MNWLNSLNQSWHLQIVVKPCHCNVSLDDAWLSGFSDADAGFYTNVLTDFRGAKKPDGTYYTKFTTKFYITQDGELDVLNKIKQLVHATSQIGTVTNGYTSKKYNRLEIHKEECINILIAYFTKYPLKGERKISCLRWARVHAYKEQHVAATERAAIKLARLISTLKEPLVEVPLSTFAQNFSKEEIKVFAELPLSARPKPRTFDWSQVMSIKKAKI